MRKEYRIGSPTGSVIALVRDHRRRLPTPATLVVMWVLQRNRRDQQLRARLTQVLTDQGQRWCEVDVPPDPQSIPTLPLSAAGEPVICHGASFVPRGRGDAFAISRRANLKTCA